jgi:hypothetical protein
VKPICGLFKFNLDLGVMTFPSNTSFILLFVSSLNGVRYLRSYFFINKILVCSYIGLLLEVGRCDVQNL